MATFRIKLIKFYNQIQSIKIEELQGEVEHVEQRKFLFKSYEISKC